MTPARHEPSSGPAWKLFLEDGTELEGVGFGAADGARPSTSPTQSAVTASSPVAGEVVFNTGMCGYVETLTDPEPPAFGTQTGQAINGGRRWIWTRTTIRSPEARIQQIRIDVADQAGGPGRATLTLFRRAAR